MGRRGDPDSPIRPVQAHPAHVLGFSAVACPSGRRCNSRKVVWVNAHRGFKSHRHRQFPLGTETLEPQRFEGFLVAAPRFGGLRYGKRRRGIRHSPRRLRHPVLIAPGGAIDAQTARQARASPRPRTARGRAGGHAHVVRRRRQFQRGADRGGLSRHRDRFGDWQRAAHLTLRAPSARASGGCRSSLCQTSAHGADGSGSPERKESHERPNRVGR